MTNVNTAQHKTAIALADGLGIRQFFLDPTPSGAAIMTIRQGRVEGRWIISPEGALA